MAFINKQDTNGTKGTLLKGELGYDDYTAGGDTGRVYVGNGSTNIALAKKTEVDAKQATLVSGTNIKTVNGTSLLGSGDVGVLPSGCIVLWSGSSASIPSGWYLCNGANGTPNLMDRFVVGAGSGYAVGATGGSTSASISGTTGATTLTTTQMPSHTHSVDLTSAGGDVSIPQTSGNAGTSRTYTTGSAGGSGSHTHSMSGSVDTRSPYYALCYIMKA